MKYTALKTLFVYLSIVVMVTGCTGLPERNPLPEALGDSAVIPGIKDARYWADPISRLLSS